MSTNYEYMDEMSIDSELICNVCQLPFIDPCCAPCGETFCRKCITKWIQEAQRSCPHCRRDLSISLLTDAPRAIRNMVNRLQVKCILCGQCGLQRANFDEHIEKMCPKTVVSCRSVDIKCLRTGQREPHVRHSAVYRFGPMRPVDTEVMSETQQQIIQIIEQQETIDQLQEQLDLQIAKNFERKNQNRQLKAQIKQLKMHRRTNQEDHEPLRQGDTQTTQSLSHAATIQTNPMAISGVEGLKGAWDYVDGENFDTYMKEIGVGFATRMAFRQLKPRLIINENNGIWTLRSETTLKTVVLDFIPGINFDEIAPNGEKVTSIIKFKENKWIHTSFYKNGTKSVVTRYIDSNDQHMVEMEYGFVKARRWYRHAE